MRPPCPILAGFVLAAAAGAQDGAIDPTPPVPLEDLRLGSIGMYWENDGAYIKPNQYSDEHYTNGLKFDFGFQGQLVDRWARRLPTVPFIGLDDEGPRGEQMRSAFGIGIAQLMFTPEDLSRSDLIEDDRPYAGYLGFNFFLQRVQGNNWEHFEVDVGVVGPASFAREVQEQVHATFPGNINPQGWNHQLSNEPVLNFNYRRRWRLDALPPDTPLGLQFIPGAGVAAGNMLTAARVDLIGRFGWNLPEDFGPSRILDLRDATARRGRHTEYGDWSVYIYGRAGGRAVAHDIFLDGNSFADSHSVAREVFVGELQFGIVGRWRFLEVGYGQTWVSGEFEEEQPSAHGAVTVNLHFPF
jgi:lipid A 3-O-deacylase